MKQAESTIAVGGNAGTNVEVSMMLDTTGSMSGAKITSLKLAANDLIDIVVWEDQSNYTSKVAIAPFADTVNVDSYFQAVTNQNPNGVTSLQRQLTGYNYPPSCIKDNGNIKSDCKDHKEDYAVYANVEVTTGGKAKCVVERTGTNEFTEVAPGAGAWITSYNDASGSSTTTCPEVSKIVPLTSDKTKLKAVINGLIANYSTAGAVGTAWAWYLLSPEWGTIFTGSTKPEAYSKMAELGPQGQPLLQKIAVLMTDGAYNTWQASSASVTTVSNKAKTLCTNMKAKGIKIYTVGFELAGDANAIATLSNCATDASHFYNAANGDALRAAFRDIALKISALRITH